MTATSIELAQTLIAFLSFGLLFVPPGFLAGYVLNVYGMRRRSIAEQLLWSLVLSVPLALLMAQGLGRLLPQWAVAGIFLGVAIAAGGLFAVQYRSPRPAAPSGTTVAVLAALVLCVWAMFATLDVQIGAQLFVPVQISDWSVRLPMVAAAEHHGFPPLNPLSDVGGGPPPALRYYYFWYVLCAIPARLLHLPPHAVFSGSTMWAGLAVFAVALLSVKYLAGESGFGKRRVRLLSLALVVIGLDGLRAVADLFKRVPHPLPDVELWREDRTPGFLTSMLDGPHHVAGLVCCFTAMLLLVESCGIADRAAQSPDLKGTGWQLTSRALLAGCAFAACAGTSTFLTFIFVTVCALWGLDLLRTRQFRALGVLLGAGVAARVLGDPFLRELRTGTSAAHGFASFAVRSAAGAKGFLAAHHLLQQSPLAAGAVTGLYVLTFGFMELGFFFFVLVDRFRGELLPAMRGSRRLRAGQRALWIVLGGAGLNALFVSSSVTQSINDLGVHAAFAVRFVLVVWSIGFLDRLLVKHPDTTAPGRARFERPLRFAAVFCLVCGLLGEVDNLVLQRFYYPMLETHALRGLVHQLTDDRLSYRLADIRSAWTWAGSHTAADARMQFDPGGVLGPAYAYFSDRQIMAVDLGCGTAFGGDQSRCQPLIDDLKQIYGGFTSVERSFRYNHLAPPARPDHVVSAAEFERACALDHLQYVFADETDPAWGERDSWVWSLRPAFANETVRVFECGVS